jgi:SAM-dependent methyltransferase
LSGNARTELRLAKEMRQLLFGHLLSRAICAAAVLGIPDLLAGGPESPEVLAERSGAHAPSLRRLLRALAVFGIFAEREDGNFELTPLAATLRTGAGGSMGAMALMFAGEFGQAWNELLHTVRTGEAGFEFLYGMEEFDYLAKNPEAARVFNQAMTESTARAADEILSTVDFSPYRTIVDVGGGEGQLLRSILHAHPEASGVVFDRPEVLEAARRLLEGEGLAERCTLVAGSFFDWVPAGGDLYILKHVLHAWDDERSLAVLRNCRQAMAPSGTLMVLEHVMVDRAVPDPGLESAALLDLHMFVITGKGRVRTESDFAELLSAAGFRLARITPTLSGPAVIEGSIPG